MSINQINNGDSGLTARTIINQVVTNVNNLSTTGTASYAITASYALNGGGGGGGTPGGLNTQIQFNSGSTFSGSQYFTYNYQSQSLQQGEDTQAIGDRSHAEGKDTKTGIQTAYSASIISGIITLSSTYNDVSEDFEANNRLYLYDSLFDNIYGRGIFIISQSYYSAPNTIIKLYDTSVSTTTAYVGDMDYGIDNWNGNQTIPGDYSHAEGDGAVTIGNRSHAEGYNTLAIGQWSHAEGAGTQAIGEYSHAEGAGTQAIGNRSHAEGDSTQAIGGASHAEGNNTKTGYKGFNSSDIGTTTPGDIYLNSSYGDVSALFIGGNFIILSDTDDDDNYGTVKLEIASSTFDKTNTIITLVNTSISTTVAVIGVFNDPEPIGANQIYIGFYSHAEGNNTQAIGYYSHAEGDGTQAIGDSSHAEGYNTQAIGYYSHAEGDGTKTIGGYSHAEGNNTQAIGDFSHAEGYNTIASGSYQHVSGRYNIHGDDTSLFIIGNGTAGGRSDAFKVRQSGSIILPVTSSGTPSWTGTQGEMIFGNNGSGNYVIWAYLGGNWRSGSLS